MKPFRTILLASIALVCVGTVRGQSHSDTAMIQVPVVFSGGHETDPRDRGRPVNLIAAALGIPPEIFREAFTHVRPAPAGTEPDPQQVRDNKSALLNALRKYEVTNERLDTVSNYYRYVRSRNELWPIKPANAYALVKDGVITKYVVTSGGSGYSSPPTITVPNMPGAMSKAELGFSRDFEKNGAVSSISILQTKPVDKK